MATIFWRELLNTDKENLSLITSFAKALLTKLGTMSSIDRAMRHAVEIIPVSIIQQNRKAYLKLL